MGGFAAILLVAGVIIIIYNLMINLSNLLKIVSYCFQTNSLSEYWNLFFKYCASGRAIYSTIIGLVIAIFLFIIIAPFVIIKGLFYAKEMKEPMSKGLHFDYRDRDLSHEKKTFYNNVEILGLNHFDVEISGLLRKDYIMVIIEFLKQYENSGKEVKSEVLQKIKMVNGEIANVPMLLILDKENIPVYFIYDEKQKQQFITVSDPLTRTGYKKIIYFSRIPMS